MNVSFSTRDAFAQIAGQMALASLLTGAISAIPMALRVSKYEPGFWAVWIPLMALASMVAVVVVSLYMAARAGARRLIPRVQDRDRAFAAVSLGLVLSAIGLGGLAMVLSVFTHHRGLGAATFALVGAGTVACSAVMAWRVAHWSGALLEKVPMRWIPLALVCGTIGAMTWCMVHQDAAASLALDVMSVADITLMMGLAIVLGQIRLPSRHKRWWVPAAVLGLGGSVLVGIMMLNNLSKASEQARNQAKVIAPVLRLILTPDTTVKPRLRTNKP